MNHMWRVVFHFDLCVKVLLGVAYPGIYEALINKPYHGVERLFFSVKVCDESCGVNRYDGYNCNWRGYGENCRFCFHDRGAALKADAVAKARGGRVIM